MLKSRTRVDLAALLALPALALAGCAGAADEPPASTPPALPTSTATAVPTPEAGPVWPDQRCQDEQLAAKITRRPDFSEPGIEGFAIVLTNTSDQACTYNGAPGVVFLDTDGTILTSAGDRPLSLVYEPGALGPGESIEAEGQLNEVGTYDCTPTTVTTVRVLITSDGAGPGIDTTTDLQVCSDARSEFQTGPLTPVS